MNFLITVSEPLWKLNSSGLLASVAPAEMLASVHCCHSNGSSTDRNTALSMNVVLSSGLRQDASLPQRAPQPSQVFTASGNVLSALSPDDIQAIEDRCRHRCFTAAVLTSSVILLSLPALPPGQAAALFYHSTFPNEVWQFHPQKLCCLSMHLN